MFFITGASSMDCKKKIPNMANIDYAVKHVGLATYMHQLKTCFLGSTYLSISFFHFIVTNKYLKVALRKIQNS